MRGGRPRPKKSLPWFGLISLFYGPFILTFALAAWAAVLSSRGDDARVHRLVGPLCLVAVGWTFVGAMLAAARYGSITILDTSDTGPRWWARVALACLPAILGLGLIVTGVCLLLRPR